MHAYLFMFCVCQEKWQMVSRKQSVIGFKLIYPFSLISPGAQYIFIINANIVALCVDIIWLARDQLLTVIHEQQSNFTFLQHASYE